MNTCGEGVLGALDLRRVGVSALSAISEGDWVHTGGEVCVCVYIYIYVCMYVCMYI